MKWLALLPMGTFGLLSGAVAIKLLLLARRTRQFPEFAISMNVLLMAAVGVPLAVAGRSPQNFGTDKGAILFAAGLFFVCLGLQMSFLFCWYVFRRHEAWARWVVVATGFIFASVWVGMLMFGLDATEMKAAHAQIKPFASSIITMQMFSAAWVSFESFRYWGMQRRRLRLDLADPVVVERFLLWGLSNFGAVLLGATLLQSLLRGNLVLRDPFALMALSILGTAMVFTQGLSFFPPKFYVRWVNARARSVMG